MEGLGKQDVEAATLLEAMEEVPVAEAIIVTKEFEGKIKKNHKTVEILPFWKWALLPSTNRA